MCKRAFIINTASTVSLLSLIFFLSGSPYAYSEDFVYKWPKVESVVDRREQYKRKILVSALEKTSDEYGAYALNRVTIDHITNTRAAEIIRDGELFNISSALTNQEWEKKTLPIRIPIRRGILNYRLLLIKAGDESSFATIHSLADLSKKTAGLRLGWSTTAIFKEANLKLAIGVNYSGLFDMLDSERFDYIPRGVNEIYNEIAERENQLNLAIEPNLALYIPAPTYFFMSPRKPILAERLEKGLEIMVQDGTLKRMFKREYSDRLDRANLKSRKIIKIDNPFLSPQTPLYRKELWFEYDED